MDLAHANRVATMGQITASIAHEIRQPLAAIKMNGNTALRWLTKTPPEIDEASQAIESVVKDANRANDVISRTRSLVTKAKPNREAFDINEAIDEVVALTSSEATKHGVVVKMELQNNLPINQGDRVQLQQVMINLIINAIEAMSGVEGPRELSIITETAATGDVVVKIKDTGPGFAPATLERLFDAFYTTKSSGMGMGLSISRSIIEDHGGKLLASANAPRGALFQFTLPTQTNFPS